MEHNSIKIEDVLTTEYADFLEFCSISGKVFVSELNSIDFVAFRSGYGQSKDRVKMIKSLLQEGASDLSKKVASQGTKSENELISSDTVKSNQSNVEEADYVAMNNSDAYVATTDYTRIVATSCEDPVEQ